MPHNGMSLVKLSFNMVYMAYSNNTINLCAIVCKINGMTIIPGIETIISTDSYAGYNISAVVLSDGKISIAHSNDSNLNSIIINSSPVILPFTTSSRIILGIAKTSGTSGQNVQVYEPNV